MHLKCKAIEATEKSIEDRRGIFTADVAEFRR
jgi:hypothetical protein